MASIFSLVALWTFSCKVWHLANILSCLYFNLSCDSDSCVIKTDRLSCSSARCKFQHTLQKIWKNRRFTSRKHENCRAAPARSVDKLAPDAPTPFDSWRTGSSPSSLWGRWGNPPPLWATTGGRGSWGVGRANRNRPLVALGADRLDRTWLSPHCRPSTLCWSCFFQGG